MDVMAYFIFYVPPRSLPKISILPTTFLSLFYSFILTFDFLCADMKGIHASTSWIALKGNNYTVANNTGHHLNVTGGGIRIVQRARGQASFNTLTNNTCYGLLDDSFCVFVDTRTKGNFLENVGFWAVNSTFFILIFFLLLLTACMYCFCRKCAGLWPKRWQ
jgi:hypothetical protein